ncbi:MAG: MBL fold metallo-hydrolase [Thermomicrobium sp.]|nr:MBL fold metallo-hydrolase [Thermomicrobium sp.]MDW8059951.1 MBL fold metallo-hydrolase [Thermomicrobium sp.]
MHVTILGGAAACPNPRQGCSGYLVTAGGYNLLIDCGPGVLPELLAHLRLDRLDGIVISHLHQDHLLDLVPLRYGLKYAPGLARRRLPVWIPPHGKGFFEDLARVIAQESSGSGQFFSETFDLIEYDPNEALDLGPLRVSFHRTRHWIPCWAVRVESPFASLAYTADTGWDDTLVAFLRGADLLIVEATLPDTADEAERAGHLTIGEAGRLAALADARRVVFAHYWAAGELHRELATAMREFGNPIELAHPGLTIRLGKEQPT